jgi:hypothetical protein
MIVLKQNQDQNITIIPTVNTTLVDLVFEFTDETTKTVYTRYPSQVAYHKDLTIAVVVTSDFLQVNSFYNLKVYNRDATEFIYYKDRVFCIADDTTIQDYSINEGQYTLPNIDNNFYKI